MLTLSTLCFPSYPIIVSNTQAVDRYTALTTAQVTTGANVIVVGVTDYVPTVISTVTDNKGNTYTRGVFNNGLGNIRTAIYYCINPTVGTGHTFTYGGGGGSYFASIFVTAFTKLNVSSVGASNNNTTSGTTMSAGILTTTSADELIVSVVGSDTAVLPTSISDNFTITNSIALAAAVNFTGGFSYLSSEIIRSVNPTWTFPTTSNKSACILSIK